MDFQLTTDGYLWRIWRTFSHLHILPLTGTQTQTLDTYLPGLWELKSYYTHPSRSKAVLCFRLHSTEAYIAICAPSPPRLARNSDLTQTTAWQLLLPLGAVPMRPKFLFASLCFSFPHLSIFRGFLAFAYKKLVAYRPCKLLSSIFLHYDQPNTSNSSGFYHQASLGQQTSEPVGYLYHQRRGLHCVWGMKMRRI